MRIEKTFSRTPYGVQNYNAFYNAELVVYTEGRCLSNSATHDIRAYDTKYYESLIKSFTGYNKVKILLVGNKNNALDYHRKIIDNQLRNCFVFIDKDYDGLFSSMLKLPKLLTTFGYSWENDFWTKKLCRDVVYNISMKDISAVNSYDKLSKRCINRLDKISRLNVVAQFLSLKILPSSESKSKGLGIYGHKKWPVAKSDFSRLKNNLREGVEQNISTSLLDFLRNILRGNSNPYNFVIQGHLFEYAVLLLIAECYKVSSEKKTADISLIKNIAFSIFEQDVKYYLSEPALGHYTNEFSRV